jgi:hypothetical protein
MGPCTPGVLHTVATGAGGHLGLYRWRPRQRPGERSLQYVRARLEQRAAKEAVKVGFDYFKANASTRQCVGKGRRSRLPPAHRRTAQHRPQPTAYDLDHLHRPLLQGMLRQPNPEQMVVLGSMSLGRQPLIPVKENLAECPCRSPSTPAPSASSCPWSTRSTSFRLPRITLTRWCSWVGWMSRMRSRPVAGGAAGLLDQPAHRVGLVHQAQLAGFAGFALVPGVQEDAAAGQDAVHVGHHAGDPAHVEVLAARAGAAGQAFVDIPLHRVGPVAHVAHVDREFLGVGAGSSRAPASARRSPARGRA